MVEIKNYIYPEIGEKVHGKDSFLMNRITCIALNVMYKGTTVALVSGVAASAAIILNISVIPVVLTAAGTCIALFLLIKAVKSVYHHVFSHRFYCELPEEVRLENRSNGPEIGTYSPCDVLVLNSAEEIYKKKLEMIGIAQESIECSFNFAGGAPFDRWLDKLIEQLHMKPHLKVHLIFSRDMLTPSNRSRLEGLRKYKNVHYLITDRYLSIKKRTFHTEENHLKVLVIDEKYFISGGTNLSEPFISETVNPEYTPKKFEDFVLLQGYRDTDFIGKGELAKTIRSQFFNLYRIWLVRSRKRAKKGEGSYFPIDLTTTNYPSFEKDCRVRRSVKTKVIVSGPEHRGNNPITREYLRMIEQAKKTIIISNLYFSPPEEILKALKQKKANEIHIEGHFNGTHSTGKYFNLEKICGTFSKYMLSSPARPFYKSCFHEVFEFSKKSIGKHKKVAVIDTLSVIGSYNFGMKSHDCDYEILFVFKSEKVSKDILKGINDDKKDSHLICTENFSPSYLDKVIGLLSDIVLKGIAF